VRSLLAALLLCSLSFAETIRLETADGVEIVGDLTVVSKDAPTVVCLPMYRHTRATYEPLVEPLKAKGFNVLALDLRGHGDSAPELADRVKKRDPAVFRAMHHDVKAAFDYLLKEGFDTTRVALVGASVGCSVAIDATVRYPYAVRAVVLLTPGASYLGMPTLEHLKRWPGTYVNVICTKEEVSRPVMDALEGTRGGATIYDIKGAHGTQMFEKAGAAENVMLTLFAEFLEPPLAVPAWKEGDPALEKPGFFRKVLGPRRKVGTGTAYLMAWVVGETWHLGVLVDTPFRGKVICHRPRLEIPFDTAKKTPPRRMKAAEGEEVQVNQGTAGGKHWLEFTLPKRPFSSEVGFVFVPEEGEPARLPNGPPFRAFPVRQ